MVREDISTSTGNEILRDDVQMLAVLDEVDALLASISMEPTDHECPDNHPFGHHDIEVRDQEVAYCLNSPLGCAHEIGDVDTSVLLDCLERLYAAGIVSDAKFAESKSRITGAQDSLVTGDRKRSRSARTLGRQMQARFVSPYEIDDVLPDVTATFDDALRPIQSGAIREKLAVVIEMKAAILHERHAIQQRNRYIGLAHESTSFSAQARAVVGRHNINM